MKSISIKNLKEHYNEEVVISGFVDNMPVAINITGKAKDDALVLNIANMLESTMPYKDQMVKEWKY